jgi:hypothetical protein
MLLESRRDELELLSQDTRQVGRSIASDGQSAALGGAFWTEGGDDQVTVRPQRPPQSAHVPALVARRDHEMKHRPLVPQIELMVEVMRADVRLDPSHPVGICP